MQKVKDTYIAFGKELPHNALDVAKNSKRKIAALVSLGSALGTLSTEKNKLVLRKALLPVSKMIRNLDLTEFFPKALKTKIDRALIGI